MSSLHFDDSGDLVLDPLTVTEGAETASRMGVRMRTARGSYFANLTLGLDRAIVFGEMVSLGLAQAEVTRVARQIAPAAQVSEQLDGREATYTVTVDQLSIEVAP